MNEYLDRSGLNEQVSFVIRQASSAVWNDLVATLAPLALRPQVYATLAIVDASPGCKQQDIADALGIHRPNLVALVDDLVARGLLERSVNADDRRSYALRLLAAGTTLLAQARIAHAEHEHRVASAIGPMARDDALGVLKRLTRLADGT